jgi:hypothetical protein
MPVDRQPGFPFSRRKKIIPPWRTRMAIAQSQTLESTSRVRWTAGADREVAMVRDDAVAIGAGSWMVLRRQD